MPIEGFDIHGVVNIQASDVTVRNCVVRGPKVAPTSGSHALIQQFDPANTSLLVEDCTLAGQDQGPITGLKLPNNWLDGGAAMNNLSSTGLPDPVRGHPEQ